MTVRIELSAEEERRLQERASRLGQDLTAYLQRLIRQDLASNPPAPGDRTFAEVLNPVHQDFLDSGMTEGELETLLEEALTESRDARGPDPNTAP